MTPEPLWPPFLALLAVGGLYAALPPSLLGGAPRWLLVAIVTALMIPIVIFHRRGSHGFSHALGYVLNLIVTVAIGSALGLLIMEVTQHTITPPRLMYSA